MYIVNDLKIEIFIEINIFILKRIIIDFAIQFIKINSCRNMIISMNSRARFEPIKRIIKLIIQITLTLRIII